MARLEFAGARYVRNYHLAVPHHELEIDRKKSLPSRVREGQGEGVGLDDNLIIHGDNLKALKSLLPHFAGKIKCIYIDPPYNTGNENWVYNDNVNSPRHKDWLNKVVDKDCQDRHDRWLSMMMPRLKLLRELLRDDGVIFISIDDNENHRLRMLMDEIFGEDNFLAELIWKSRQIVDSRNENKISVDDEYILTYGKTGSAKFRGKLSDKTKYSNPDKDSRGPWMSNSILGLANEEGRPNLHYAIKDPKTGKSYQCPPDSGWRYSKDTMQKKIDDGRIIFPAKVDGRPREKKYLSELADDYTGFSSILDESVGYTLHGTRELREILGVETFAFPKPSTLIMKLVEQVASDGDLVLDSFAGSGTTAHAVLALNKEDGGNRKFILVEQEDYADTITAERVRRVIKGVPGAKDENLKKGLGGSFTYVTLGQEFDMEKMLSGENLPSYETMAAYCYLTAIGKPWEKSGMRKRDRFIGTSDEYDVYLFYEPDVEKLKSKDLALALDWVEEQEESPKKKKLVFAPVRFVSRENMEKYGLEYCQLPYEIYRKVEEKTATNTEKKK